MKWVGADALSQSSMYKIKTHSGAKKRFKFTATGKIVRGHANKSHILNKKSRKRKRVLRTTTTLDRTNMLQIRTLMNHK